jgi:hypothetical protein
MTYKYLQAERGITLVGTLITIAITVMVFTSIISAVVFSARLSADSSARLAAMTLATERIEYFRSLPYDAVGTISGFPAGVIPQSRTISLNGVDFTERVLVDYVDDPADGAAGADSNGVITDYKKIKMELSWVARGSTSSIAYVTNIVPVSVETNAGGGAINVEVNDADGAPLEDAVVRVTNDVEGIDITRNSGPNGIASFIVPAASGYHASATKANYSADMTYRSTVDNPNPSPGSFSVVESLISDQAFRIGELSDLEITTYSSVTDASSTVSFVTWDGVVATNNVVLQGGGLQLEENLGVFAANGTATLAYIDPPTVLGWEKVVVVGHAIPNTDYRIYVYTGTTTGYELVDEGDLPGNAVGFTDRIIDLSGLSVATYPDLTIELELTGDTTATPRIEDVAVYYRASEVLRGGVDLTVQSHKTIGTGPDVYKYEANHTTDGGGTLELEDMEFDDEYTVVNNDGVTLVRACADTELDFAQVDVLVNHQAGVDTELELVYDTVAADTLWVLVKDDSGEPLPGATVTLTRGGFSAVSVSDSCGQVFFGSTDGAEADYVVDVERVGYTSFNNDPFEIVDNTRLEVVLIEL